MPLVPAAAFVPALPLRRARATSARATSARGRRRARMSAADGDDGCVQVPDALRATRVLALGAAHVDLLATVEQFPRPDDKIRTQQLQLFGGGNVSNSVTAVRRLGVPCALVSKVGDDVYGRAVLDELARDGVDTRFVQMKAGVNTALTYVIVDSTHNTRTCINTPAREELSEHDVSECMLDDVQLLMLDGRHTLAAIRLAQMASARQIPIVLDMERNRPHIERLLPYADYLITNSTYPFVFSPTASTHAQALRHLLQHCQARFVICTRGSSGSMLVRAKSARKMSAGVDLLVQRTSVVDENTGREYEVLDCPAWTVDSVVDTSGAGDAFIGGVAYGVVTNMDLERMLSLASYVAAAKLGALGARTALPRREHVPSTLLATLPSMADTL